MIRHIPDTRPERARDGLVHRDNRAAPPRGLLVVISSNLLRTLLRLLRPLCSALRQPLLDEVVIKIIRARAAAAAPPAALILVRDLADIPDHDADQGHAEDADLREPVQQVVDPAVAAGAALSPAAAAAASLRRGRLLEAQVVELHSRGACELDGDLHLGAIACATAASWARELERLRLQRLEGRLQGHHARRRDAVPGFHGPEVEEIDFAQVVGLAIRLLQRRWQRHDVASEGLQLEGHHGHVRELEGEVARLGFAPHRGEDEDVAVGERQHHARRLVAGVDHDVDQG
mmetsp:Transcript_53182/g.156660  ORF Transcript_53182/g.156660 Transcript_53182/m.156660 type:complete len:289 (-) Transcript_53182:1062-1928(-)